MPAVLDRRPARYRDLMIERLPAEVPEVLALVLDQDDPVHAALRAQVPHLRVTGPRPTTTPAPIGAPG